MVKNEIEIPLPPTEIPTPEAELKLTVEPITLMKYIKGSNKLPVDKKPAFIELKKMLDELLSDCPSASDTNSAHAWLEEAISLRSNCSTAIAELEGYKAGADLMELNLIKSGRSVISQELWKEIKGSSTMVGRALDGAAPDIVYWLEVFKGLRSDIDFAGKQYQTMLSTERQNEYFSRMGGSKNTQQ